MSCQIISSRNLSLHTTQFKVSMTHGKRIHAFNCPKLKRTILTLDQRWFVCMYSMHTYGCLSFFFKSM